VTLNHSDWTFPKTSLIVRDGLKPRAEDADAGIEVQPYFVRGRERLMSGEFGDLSSTTIRHLSANRIEWRRSTMRASNRALAAFTPPWGSRPWNERTAWTINFQQTLGELLFFCLSTGDTRDRAVTGAPSMRTSKEGPENPVFCGCRGQPQSEAAQRRDL